MALCPVREEIGTLTVDLTAIVPTVIKAIIDAELRLLIIVLK